MLPAMDGPAGLAFKSPSADLTQLSTRNGRVLPDARVKRHVQGEQLIQAHGSRKMPVCGKVFRRESTGSEARMQYHDLSSRLNLVYCMSLIIFVEGMHRGLIFKGT